MKPSVTIEGENPGGQNQDQPQANANQGVALGQVKASNNSRSMVSANQVTSLRFSLYKGFTENEGFRLNPSIRAAIDMIQDTRQHLFITGKAGTGKSTLLRKLVEAGKNTMTAVVAPTGIAAVNIDGQTIHRFLGIHAAATNDEVIYAAQKKGVRSQLYTSLQTLVIDEMSMVRADLFDQLDIFLRTARNNPEPFGGVRIIGFGDLYQLSPVVTAREEKAFSELYASPYFFSAKVYKRITETASPRGFGIVQLTEVYRQKDRFFIDLLEKIRYKEAELDDLEKINSRVITDQKSLSSLMNNAIYLSLTNAKSDTINEQKLRELPGREYLYVAQQYGSLGDFHKPAPDNLVLKIGARVMLLFNADDYQNGTIGTVVAIDDNTRNVFVQLDKNRQIVEVYPKEWFIKDQFYNQKTKTLDSETVGSYIQMPLKLAWAVTVHKSQGQTFSNVIIDFESHVFAEGQVYVALSRAVSFDGVHLVKPLKRADIKVNPTVNKYFYNQNMSQNGSANSTNNSSINSLNTNADSESLIIQTLKWAIANKQPVEIVYKKKEATPEKRKVLPLRTGVYKFGKTEYFALEAYCYLRNDTRHFVIKRIQQINVCR